MVAVGSSNKRSVSPPNFSGINKKAKLVDNFLGYFGINNSSNDANNNTTINTNANNTSMMIGESPSMAKFNRFRSEKLGNRNVSDITALKLYHDSLKKQNNERYNELLGETNTYEPTTDAYSIQEDQTFNNNDSNGTVVLRGHKRPFQESRDSSLMVIPSLQRKVSIPTLRQQLSRINPKERSNLINLKRKMKLDAYYRRKMNYLNYYNQNNVQSNNTSMNTSLMSLNTSFQPIDRRTQLQSTKRLESHVDKKQKKKEVTNTSGVFNGSFMYDLDEDDEEEEKNSKDVVGYKPINIEIKSDTNKYGQKSLAPGMENILDGQKKPLSSLKPVEEKKVTFDVKKDVKVIPNEKKEEIVGPSSGFSFANNSKFETRLETKGSDIISKPSSENSTSLPFNASKPVSVETTAETKPSFSFNAPKSEPKPSFSFSAPKSTETAESKPSFSFNAPKSEPKPSFSFSAPKSTETAESKPSFSFNAPKSTETAESKPSFSFSAPKSTETAESKPSFSFNAPKSTETAESKPPFSFSAPRPITIETVPDADVGVFKPAETKKIPLLDDAEPSLKKEEPAKTSFTLGDSSEKKDDKPSFLFGAPASEKKEESTKNSFSFGGAAKAIPQKNLFGNTSSEKEDSKPAFSFTASTAKPSFSFGGEKKEETKPAFSFSGSSDSTTKPVSTDSLKPFSFGAGQNKENQVEEEREEGDKKRRLPGKSESLFSFGAENGFSTNKIESPKPTTAFTFGNTGSKTAGFNFGGATSSTPSVSSEAGATTTTTKPLFNFANTAANAGFGSTNTVASSKESTPLGDNKFNFGATTKPLFGNRDASATPFGGSGKSTPVFPQQQQQASFQFNGLPGGAPQQSSGTFNFGNNSNPGSTFNPSRSTTPGFNFTGAVAPLNPASIFGANSTTSSTPAFGNPQLLQQQQQQQQQLQPGNMFGIAGGSTPTNNVFGGINQQQQPPANVFGGQQQQQQQPANVFGGSPAPGQNSATPIPGRRIARMRQPRSHR